MNNQKLNIEIDCTLITVFSILNEMAAFFLDPLQTDGCLEAPSRGQSANDAQKSESVCMYVIVCILHGIQRDRIARPTQKFFEHFRKNSFN